jgi:hypothetical protein
VRSADPRIGGIGFCWADTSTAMLNLRTMGGPLPDWLGNYLRDFRALLGTCV